MPSRRAFCRSVLMLPTVPQLLHSALRPAHGNADTLPPAFSLESEYKRYGFAAQAQQGDTCWAYSILTCLELELARAGRGTNSLSGPYLAWAAATTDTDVFDGRGSNFARAARALERFGVCAEKQLPKLNTDAPASTPVSNEVVRSGIQLGQDIHIDWLRFWRTPPGLTEDEMDAVKGRIAAGHAVAVGMRWPKNLTVEDKQLCLLGTCKNVDETYDGHCVTLVGYQDDSRFEGGGTFLIRNSWGAGWMQEGFARMSYAYLQRYANDAIAFAIEPKNPCRLRPTAAAPSNIAKRPVQDVTPALCRPDAGVGLSEDNVGRYRQNLWQGNNQVFCRSQTNGKGFALDFPIAKAGNYTLSIAGTRAPDYGIWRVLVDGKVLAPPCNFNWPAVAPTGEIVLGTMPLRPGKHTLRFERAGKSIAATGFLFGLDWFRVQPATG